MNQINTIGDQVTASLLQVWEAFVNFIPELVSALLVIIIGLIVAALLGKLTRTLLRYAQLDALSERSGLTAMMSRLEINFSFSWLIGKIVQWFFIIVFILAAADILGWNEVTLFLRDILLYLPNVAVAILILAAGLIVGNFADRVVSHGISATRLPIANTDLLGTVAKMAIITFAALAALIQLGVAASLIQIVVAGFVFALALAFGLGGKDKAREILERLDQERQGGANA